MGSGEGTGRAGASAFALIVLDGLGDRPNPDTGGLSPVEAAATPNLDRLASRGEVGTVSILGPGVAPESDAGVFALFGYDPVRDSPGRGVLEAMGVDVPLGPGDVALRLNFATVDPSGRVTDPRVGRSLSTGEAARLARAVTDADLLADEGIRAEVRPTVGHRGVLWLRPVSGGELSPEISNADPFYEKVGGMGQARRRADPRVETVQPLAPGAEAARTARALNLFLERVRPVLARDPVNAERRGAGTKEATGLLVRNAGRRPRTAIPSFEARYGLRGAAVTEMPVERGIAKLLGLADHYVGPMGADREAGYRSRAATTRQVLAESPFVYVHLKGPDEPGHDGDAKRKQAVIEEIDRSFFGPFVDGLDLGSVRLAVTADHSTPCLLKAHSDDPVPWLLVGEGVPSRGMAERTKFGTAPGAAPSWPGREALPRLLGRQADALRR